MIIETEKARQLAEANHPEWHFEFMYAMNPDIDPSGKNYVAICDKMAATDFASEAARMFELGWNIGRKKLRDGITEALGDEPT
jgi:hypothetical protein